MNPVLKSILSAQFLYAILRVMTPLLFPALGVAISDLAGSVNISLEGIMLVSACAGVLVSALTKSLLLALLAGMAAGLAMGAVLGYFHLRLKADIILAAIALNIFASGITIFVLFVLTGEKGSTSSLASRVFPTLAIPGLQQVPVLGQALSGHNVLTYGALLAVLLFYLIVFKTPLGLRIRAVGQNPHAAESVGIDVNRTRLYALLLSGFFGSFGGLYLSMGYVSWFARDMAAGRGFIAIAAATLGSSMPLGTLLASLLFGTVNALAIYLASIQMPSEFIQMIPYLATVVALTVYAAQATRKRRLRPLGEPRSGVASGPTGASARQGGEASP